MTVFTCKDDFESMMTCIYDAWASKRGHDQVKLMREPILQQDLFCEYIHVEGDAEKTQKVVRSIRNKISQEAYLHVFYATLSNAPDALDVIYRFLILGFAYGGKVLSMLSYPAVMRMMQLQRNVGNEAHYFREFMRFAAIEGGVYAAHFEPKNNVLISVAGHFQDRMPSEHWLIVDDTRSLAAIHPRNEDFYIRMLTEKEMDALSETEKYQDEFTKLWFTFFDSIGIRERENPKCQRNLFPLWLRKHAVEFMRDN